MEWYALITERIDCEKSRFFFVLRACEEYLWLSFTSLFQSRKR